MAEKLRSITKRIPWFSLLKAACFAGLWAGVSYPLFFVGACVLYFLPLRDPRRALLEFGALLLIAALIPFSSLNALLLGIMFFLAFGLKEFMFADPLPPRETFLVLLAFLLFLTVFSGASFRFSTVIPPLFSALALSTVLTVRLFREAALRNDEPEQAVHPAFYAFLIGFLVAEIGVIASLLPMNFLYKTALTFFSFALLVEFFLDYVRDRVRAKTAFISFSLFFVFVLVVMLSNTWRP